LQLKGAVLKSLKVKLAITLAVVLCSASVSMLATADTTKTSYTGREVLDEVLPHFNCYVYFNKGNLIGVAGEDLAKNEKGETLIYDSESFKPVKVTFRVNQRLTTDQVARWLIGSAGLSSGAVKQVLNDPESVQKKSCAAQQRYQLSTAMAALYKSGTTRHHVCRALAKLGYKLNYDGKVDTPRTHSRDRQSSGEDGNGSDDEANFDFPTIKRRTFVWKKGSNVLPWEGLHSFGSQASSKWSSGMLYSYFDRYLEQPVELLVAALAATASDSKQCNSFKVNPTRAKQPKSGANHYMGSDVIFNILPKVGRGITAYRLVNGEYVSLHKGERFHRGDTFYDLYKGKLKQPKLKRTYQVTFDSDELLTRNQLGAWMRVELRLGGGVIVKVLGPAK